MTGIRARRWLWIGLVAVGVLAVVAVTALHFAAKALKGQIEQALGPDSEVGAIAVGWSTIEIRNLRIRGPKGWPAEDALRAERIVVAPDLRALLSAAPRVHRITVEKGYLSMVRVRDGRLRVVPGLTESKPAGKSGVRPPTVALGAVELRDTAMDFYDETVRRPAHRLRLENLQALVEDLRVPDLSGRTRLKLEAMVKGVQRNGTAAVQGWVEIATRDSEIVTRLRGVDLVALQPYLIKAAETGVRRGSLDLDLNSVVRKNALRAPGTMTLTGLELAEGGGALGTFMGMPRQAVLAALRNNQGQIRMNFTLEGRLDDPKFSLNESFATRVGAGVAQTLGVSIEGLARGVGGAARGVGDTLRGLFGR